MGVEPTIRSAKGRIGGFEGRDSHRTVFASARIINYDMALQVTRGTGWPGLKPSEFVETTSPATISPRYIHWQHREAEGAPPSV